MLGEQIRHAFEQVGAGAGCHAAHRVFTEDGLEQFGADHAATAGNTCLNTGNAAGEAERGDHEHHGGGVHTQGEEAGAFALVGAFFANHFEHGALPEANLFGNGCGEDVFGGLHFALRFVALRLAVCACVLFGRRGGGRLRRNRNSLRRIKARQQGASGAAGTPAGAGVFGGAGGRIQHDGVDAAFEGVFYLLGGGGLAAQGGADAVAQAADGAVEGAEEVAGSHEVVPAREHFAA